MAGTNKTGVPRSGDYLTRTSYYEYMIHLQDNLLHTGYDWRNNLFTQSTSKYLLSEPKRAGFIAQYQKLLVYVIDRISIIKKSFNYTVDKNYKYLN